MSVEWGYFDKFDAITDKYLPDCGEGGTLATQTVTAVSKLVYKWYNDGDVFDNTYGMEGWCNDLSSYANWLYDNTKASDILDEIENCYTFDDYENLLKELADTLFDEDYLTELNEIEKKGSIYECEGKFEFNDEIEEEYDEELDDEEYDYDEEER